MKKICALLVAMLSLVSVMAFAQTEGEPQYDEAKEAEIAMKAKKRLYPGGRDEEDLKLQSQLTTPVRKLSPQTEIQSSEPEAEEN